jgi:hypothetical protein
MFQREREKWMSLLETEREAARRERQELLNRIAAPERVVVDSSSAEHEAQPMTPTDLELSMVGREVPDGVSVGSLRDDVNHG